MKLLQVKGPLINTKEEAMKALGIDKRLIGELDYGVTIKVAIYQPPETFPKIHPF